MHGTYIKITQYDLMDVLFWHFMRIPRKFLSRESLSQPKFEMRHAMVQYCHTRLFDSKSPIRQHDTPNSSTSTINGLLMFPLNFQTLVVIRFNITINTNNMLLLHTVLLYGPFQCASCSYRPLLTYSTLTVGSFELYLYINLKLVQSFDGLTQY